MGVEIQVHVNSRSHRSEIEPRLLLVRFLRHIAADDSSNIVNPLLLERRLHGDILHLIGQAFSQEAVYDEHGRPRRAK